ncbi:MAG: mandelate racemase, partial [Candidatus Eremiobacteraeota bacterium]|nr:mandelate racemase [Candidatus Eremiobacteraeota bacterium]
MIAAASTRLDAIVRSLEVRAYRIPTEDASESDGTIEWNSTTLVLVEVRAGDHTGIGYTYADAATATLIREMLCDRVVGSDAGCIAET